MNRLSFDDPSLDNLDPTLSLHDPSDIDTALLSDIDGKKMKEIRLSKIQVFKEQKLLHSSDLCIASMFHVCVPHHITKNI